MSEEIYTSTLESAIILTASIRAALRNGVKHFDDNGDLLETEKDILECLKSEGHVLCDENERVQRVTDKEMVEEVRKEWSSRIQ